MEVIAQNLDGYFPNGRKEAKGTKKQMENRRRRLESNQISSFEQASNTEKRESEAVSGRRRAASTPRYQRAHPQLLPPLVLQPGRHQICKQDQSDSLRSSECKPLVKRAQN